MLDTLKTAARITLDPRHSEPDREARALDYLCARLARTRVLTAPEIRDHLITGARNLRAQGVIQ